MGELTHGNEPIPLPAANVGFFSILVGIFLTGILAVLLASLYARPRQA